ncbi:MAG: repressor LexA [Acidobacteria bacterium]|nr:MAG: repressor LexA [Acidobacteriota bacterium]
MTFLTTRQRDVLEFIERQIVAHGVAPTLQEISTHFGFLSTASAQKHVNLLVRKRFLDRDKHQKRGLTVVEERAGQALTPLPLVGTVAAGSPIENFGEAEETTVPPDMVGQGEHFVLQVRGLSMIDDGIHDGDHIVVKRVVEARPGDTVVALVDGEATLKRFFPEADGKIRLQGANPTLAPIVIPASSVVIQGILVGLLRKY